MGKEREENILNGIIGMVYPVQILAMLGHSSSGKTSLLNVLGGRMDAKFEGQWESMESPLLNQWK